LIAAVSLLATTLHGAGTGAPLVPTPSRHDLVFDTANGLKANGKSFCTQLVPPVEREPHLGSGPGPKTCTVVVAAYGQTSSEYALLLLLVPPVCKVVVYDKDDPKTACGFMPMAGVDQCIVLPNVGREQHTWAYYVRTHYGALPDVAFFIPADLPAHDRAHNVQLMLNSTVYNETAAGGGIVGPGGGGFWCINQTAGKACDGFPTQDPMPLSENANCSFPVYCRGAGGKDVGAADCQRTEPTEEPTLQLYMQANVGRASPHTMDRLCYLPLCHYGVAATTRHNLLSHPVEVFANIEATLNQSVTPEAIWMMEWGMAVAYGIGGARTQAACDPGYPYPATCRATEKSHKAEPSPSPKPEWL